MKHSLQRLELASARLRDILRMSSVRLRPDALGQRDVALKMTPDGGSAPTQASIRWSSETYCPSSHSALKPGRVVLHSVAGKPLA
jgi:hypothetical protein